MYDLGRKSLLILGRLFITKKIIEFESFIQTDKYLFQSGDREVRYEV